MDVSRETLDQLEEFQALLLKWTRKINLISRSSASDGWDRHILDSIQLAPFIESGSHVVDLGSGGGLPAIPLAIIFQGQADTRFTLVESDQRKGEFLRTAIRQLKLKAKVITDRIEDTPPLSADILTARALASCKVLFRYTERHMKPTGQALLLKGETAVKELEDARANWAFSVEQHPSTTNSQATLLQVREIRRV